VWSLLHRKVRPQKKAEEHHFRGYVIAACKSSHSNFSGSLKISAIKVEYIKSEKSRMIQKEYKLQLKI